MKATCTLKFGRYLAIAFLLLTCVAVSAQQLAISRGSTNVILTWSTNYSDFVLESAGNLGGSWTNVAEATNCAATLPMVSSNQFFRLKQQDMVAVTYILNEGFMISNRNTKILIDGIFSRAVWDFWGAGGEILNQQTNALPPFTNINVMLFSHNHSDHLDGRFAFQNMTNDPTPLVLGPQAVYNTMRSSLGSRFPIVSNRIVTASPPNGSSTNVTVAGIDFKVVGLTQSDDPAFNTGFLFTLGGLRFLHVGDNYSTNLFDYTPMEGEQIDVAMINCYLFDNPQGVQEVMNLLHPGTMLVMHQTPDQIENYRNIINGLTNVPPYYMMSTNTMVTYRFPAR